MENSPGSATPQKPRTYYGFISYSHRDSALVRRLHCELELYRVPQRLVGKPSPVEARKAEADRRHARDLVRRAEPARARTHEGQACMAACNRDHRIDCGMHRWLLGGRVLWPSGKPRLREARKRGIGPAPLSRG